VATFVIVHGGWGGGWEWTAVAKALRNANHEVFTPTLTGMGERAHLSVNVGITTHVQDIVAVLQLEDLHDVVLCGHSYGGMPITGATDQVAERIGFVVYIDALVPLNGQSVLDLLPESLGDALLAAASEHGDGWRVPILPELLPPEGSIPEEERTRYVARLRDQPLATFTEPLHLTGALKHPPRAFLRCTGGGSGDNHGEDPIAPFAARARAEGWLYRELAAAHDAHLIDPAGTAAVLHEMASMV
jgi:pimeloyl-ACP methyl ester carboxylesterase